MPKSAICDSCGCKRNGMHRREMVISGTSAKDYGWLIETRPTLGGGEVSVSRCFPCRQLTIESLETGVSAL